MRDYYKNITWFKIYTKYILPIFGALNVLSLISTYAQTDFSNVDSVFFTMASLLDIIFVVLTIKTLIDVVGEENWSVKLLIALFVYNWVYKSICTSLAGGSEYLLGFIIAATMNSIYYIPNIIYFYHRRDYFLKIENISNIKKKKEIEKKMNSENKIDIDKKSELINEISYKSEKKEDEEGTEKLNIINEKKDNDEIIHCIYCNAEVSKNDKFCCECGKKIEEEKIYCVKCGKIMDKSWKFCKNCGEKKVD